jgi:hypothetical protein
MSLNNIDALVADLTPVRPVAPRDAFALMAAATAVAVLLVALMFGLRPDVMSGTPDPIVVVRSGIVFVLGLATVSAAIASARPGVGQRSTGWHWALAAAAIFPITAAVLAMANRAEALVAISSVSGLWCLGISGFSALFIGGLLTAWLRQGAPTSINRTSWLVGLAAGSFGTLAYSLHCPSTTVYYVGLWYTLAIALSAGVARLTVPRLIRW